MRKLELYVTDHGFGGICARGVGDPSVQGPEASSSIPTTGRRRTRLFRGSCTAIIGYGIVTDLSSEMGRQVYPLGLVFASSVAFIISCRIVAAVQSLARSLWLVMGSDCA